MASMRREYLTLAEHRAVEELESVGEVIFLALCLLTFNQFLFAYVPR